MRLSVRCADSFFVTNNVAALLDALSALWNKLNAATDNFSPLNAVKTKADELETLFDALNFLFGKPKVLTKA